MAPARPDVTVAYLTKNGGAAFRRSIESTLGQRTQASFEVLVVDSGSTDGTPEWAQTRGARVVRIEPSQFNYGATKNLAVRESRGEYIVFLSQDNIPATDSWLESLLRRFRNGALVVQGPALSEPDGYFWWSRGGFFYTRETRRWLREFGIGLSSCNLAIRRDVLERVPFRSVPMNEDKVLQRDLRAVGIETIEAPDAPILHTHTYGPRALTMRLRNEGLGWRSANVRYSIVDLLADSVSPQMWARTWAGVLRGQIHRPHEFLFPLLRPLMIYKGLHFTSVYQWEREPL
ncbi:MAG: hypothetical protein A2W26_11945 [Acidobacteria bacterium RBG_16_64_8]|nr:MAG: hypothetical protein A2W26_11945 [Acidobacteria bacterium RBG_16_64_8]